MKSNIRTISWIHHFNYKKLVNFIFHLGCAILYFQISEQHLLENNELARLERIATFKESFVGHPGGKNRHIQREFRRPSWWKESPYSKRISNLETPKSGVTFLVHYL